MPIKLINGKKVIELDYKFSLKYWTELSKTIAGKYVERTYNDSESVQMILKDCFAFFCDEFMNVMANELKASFFIFVQDLHEDSVEIWSKQLNAPKLPINQADFIVSRRIMKYILEQGTRFNLTGAVDFSVEIKQNISNFTKHLEELLYTGSYAFQMSEFIAQSQICPRSTSINVKKEELIIYTNVPFNSLFEFIQNDFDRHKHRVVISDSIIELKTVLAKEVQVDYDLLCYSIFDQIKNVKYKYATFKLDKLIEELVQSKGYSKQLLETFYGGLTITRNNVMTITDSILRTQDMSRYMYRPILNYTIDNKDFWIIGANKWSESLVSITTNCLPFGQFPEEWKQIKPLAEFAQRIKDTHDKILEEPAIEIIRQAGLQHDNNVKTLKTANNQGISIEKEGVGEIDLLFIDEKQKFITVAECKHNRSRFEFNNWKRDISSFVPKYENQLQQKKDWVSKNKIVVLEHLEILHSIKISNKEDYIVIPIFVINAPTLYMYDSDYLVVTLEDLYLLLNGHHKTMMFEGKIKNKHVQILPPYFKNIEKEYLN